MSATIALLAWAATPLEVAYFGETALWPIALETLVIIAFGGAWFGLGKLERQFY